MCGIFCLIENGSTESFKNKNYIEVCKNPIHKRGPDNFSQIELNEETFKLHFMGSVRWTQGIILTPQPLEDKHGNILLWNGDVYQSSFDTITTTDPDIVQDSNNSDTIKVLHCMSTTGVIKTLKLIEGPYSFIFYNRKDKIIWYGKDPIGRHSLLCKINSTSLLLTSVGNKTIPHIEEVNNTHVYSLDITSTDYVSSLKEYQWKRNISICPILKQYHPKTPSQDIPVPDDVIKYFKQFNKDIKVDKTDLIKQLAQFELYNKNVDLLINKLKISIERRIKTQPRSCLNCQIACKHCKTGILFSGGIDSTVIALLANEFIPIDEPIDLLNVAFEKNQNFDVPDRITGLSSLNELKDLCPGRLWNFIEVNIERDELEEKREETIKDVIYPLDTVLDDSLGCAVWFAARGEGTLNGCNYISPARVLLLGMGADEQLGGYARHRNILRYSNTDWSALRAQLEHEVLNICRRNLGRDNRVVSDHGRQPRTPFLDENVVGFLLNLPSWQRCWITDDLPVSVGDKLLLRLVAWKLGLKIASLLPKRALQFGSRIANSREKGNDVCQRL